MSKLLAVIRMAFIDGFEYRTDMLFYILGGIVRPLVFLAIWLALLASGGKTQYNSNDFIIYYLLVMIEEIGTAFWATSAISRLIRLGDLSPFLLKPFSYVFYQLGNNLGGKVFKMIYVVPIIIAIILLLRIDFKNLTLISFLLFVLSSVFALSITFFMYFCSAITAFWFDDSKAVVDFLDFFTIVFSGDLFPLVLLPPALQTISQYLPFRYMISFPIEIFLGKLSADQLLFGFGFQIFWVLATILLYSIVWKKGLKNYSASGN